MKNDNNEYGKYDWISYVLLIGALSCLVCGWIFHLTILLIPFWICIITDWIFSSWNRKRKGKLFAKRILECNETFKETIEHLNKLKEKKK